MQNIINDGILLINKEQGKTSFQTINEIKRVLKIKKIGHAGTLDKNATGLMISALGKSTKLLKFFIKLPKKYIAEIKFGIQTTTDDPEGTEINRYEGKINFEVIKKYLPEFYGKIKQTPPDFSAIHVNGERAYKIALKDKKPDIKEREIEIKQIDILEFKEPILKLEIECSSGTYIRSIARDIGLKTGYFAHLSSLERESISNFSITSAFNIQDIIDNNFKIISPFDALQNIKGIDIKSEYVDDIKNGKKINFDYFNNSIETSRYVEDSFYKLHYKKNLLAIVLYKDGYFKYDLVY